MNQAKTSSTVSIMDLGKMLLVCAKDGDTSKVHELMSRGAPFTTDWVCCHEFARSVENEMDNVCVDH